MLCRDFREVADSYLGDELSVETNHEILAHLEMCAACRRELTARRDVRSTLRLGFANAAELQIDEQFARRLRSQLAAQALLQPTHSRARGTVWLAIAACLIIALGIGVFTLRNRFRTTPENLATAKPGSAEPVNLSSKTANALAKSELVKFAVDDHQNCAIAFHLSSAPISLEEAARTYDRAYTSLTDAMKEQLSVMANPPALVEVHSCVFGGRRFAHFVFKQNGHVVSLLVTDVDDLETTTEQANDAATLAAGQVISCSKIQGYQVSCLQTPRHAIFVVSDLSESENLRLARTLAPAIYQHVARAERVASA
jgi:hypothetical protein